MARIELPPGDEPENVRALSLRPRLQTALDQVERAVWTSELPRRMHELVRMRVARINGCTVCMSWRNPTWCDDEELLAGVEAQRVVAGHIHIAFRRAGPGGIELLNPGSVGMPWDGDHRAAYALIDGDRVEQRRVKYDWQKAVAAVRDWVGELPARRMELARFQVD